MVKDTIVVQVSKNKSGQVNGGNSSLSSTKNSRNFAREIYDYSNLALSILNASLDVVLPEKLKKQIWESCEAYLSQVKLKLTAAESSPAELRQELDISYGLMQFVVCLEETFKKAQSGYSSTVILGTARSTNDYFREQTMMHQAANEWVPVLDNTNVTRAGLATSEIYKLFSAKRPVEGICGIEEIGKDASGLEVGPVSKSGLPIPGKHKTSKTQYDENSGGVNAIATNTPFGVIIIERWEEMGLGAGLIGHDSKETRRTIIDGGSLAYDTNEMPSTVHYLEFYFDPNKLKAYKQRQDLSNVAKDELGDSTFDDDKSTYQTIQAQDLEQIIDRIAQAANDRYIGALPLQNKLNKRGDSSLPFRRPKASQIQSVVIETGRAEQAKTTATLLGGIIHAARMGSQGFKVRLIPDPNSNVVPIEKILSVGQPNSNQDGISFSITKSRKTSKRTIHYYLAEDGILYSRSLDSDGQTTFFEVPGFYEDVVNQNSVRKMPSETIYSLAAKLTLELEEFDEVLRSGLDSESIALSYLLAQVEPLNTASEAKSASTTDGNIASASQQSEAGSQAEHKKSSRHKPVRRII